MTANDIGFIEYAIKRYNEESLKIRLEPFNQFSDSKKLLAAELIINQILEKLNLEIRITI